MRYYIICNMGDEDYHKLPCDFNMNCIKIMQCLYQSYDLLNMYLTRWSK